MDSIIGAARWVSSQLSNELDHKEHHYQNLLIYKLQRQGFVVSSEENIEYSIRDKGHKVLIGFGLPVDLHVDLAKQTKKHIVSVDEI